ncbi:hypothetical protein LPB67_07815 [Undibacterium sp. Jales W-56]|uniref:hypothetical protein n=1 Tax=Undibacterium sp. Jales W-56 TaxID=2897325 RepID=UPI0021CFE719|nr:hypothetical protein [Undibacterium sp. Jales W-56]MCU6433684.1 hypothetical protein [Undibacterium sp. Jales W-56]
MASQLALRWIVLLGALALTLLAIWYPVEEPGDVAEPVATRLRVEHVKTVAFPQVPAVTADDSEEGSDPFAPRGWQAPPPSVSAPAVVSSNTPVAPPTPVEPPPLPFRFIGRMNDGDQQIIYLGRGDQSLAIHGGETLDGIYKVLQIDLNRVEFEHIPTGEKQELTLTVTSN